MFIPFVLDLKYECHKSNAVYLNSTVNHSIIIEYNNFIKRVSYVLNIDDSVVWLLSIILSEQYCLSSSNAVVLLKYHTVNDVHANLFE